MLKTWVWISGDHAALLRAKTYDQAYGMVLSEIIYSGCYLSFPNGVPCNSDGTETVAVVKQAVDLYESGGHQLHEITEPDIARRPLDVSAYGQTL
jgi:hypothetical protein